MFPGHRTWFGPGIPTRLVRGGLTGAATAFVVLLGLCQSPVRNSAETKSRGLVVQLDHLRRPLRCQVADGCVQHFHQAAQASGVLRQQRPAWLFNAATRPVRADPPPKTIRTITATGTTTIIQAAKDLINQGCVEGCQADEGCIIQPVAQSPCGDRSGILEFRYGCEAAVLGDLRVLAAGDGPLIVSPAGGAGAACADCARRRRAAIRFRTRRSRAGTSWSVSGRS